MTRKLREAQFFYYRLLEQLKREMPDLARCEPLPACEKLATGIAAQGAGADAIAPICNAAR
jgi:hypothetical protein